MHYWHENLPNSKTHIKIRSQNMMKEKHDGDVGIIWHVQNVNNTYAH